ncbi:hypothetical protein CK203_014590 [Vitis vinifera]|uniref:Retrovirus-related Pol polyprotein from transposon TNT 1-94 n=1 Tax=Vitis vinifera TaxID=29760 RepID=A0A438K567_VITVI|nr:hypothetical protein CK203_014590 [Vitis vinifera]
MKKGCTKFQKWLEKKGKSISFACYESNMVDVIYNTWWIDSGSTIMFQKLEGKETNKSKKGAKRSTDILEIIHSDICCPDMDAYDPKYFISFIDDYSRYMYIYLLHNKNEALGAFKFLRLK